MVGGRWITAFDIVERRLGQRGLKLHYRGGSFLGVSIAVSSQLEHICDVDQIFRPRLLEALFSLHVIVAVRKPQPTCRYVGNHLRWIVVVGSRVQPEGDGDAYVTQAPKHF